MMILLVLGVMFGACGGAASPPEAAFESLKSAAVSQDWGAIYDLMAPSEVAKAEKDWEDAKKSPQMSRAIAEELKLSVAEFKGMSYRDTFVKMVEIQKSTEEISASELVETTVDGARATLKIKSAKGVESLRLVKEDGKWYVTGMGAGL
jgi:hypothetical protein